MSSESSKYPTLKQKLSREMVEWLWILLYLAFFFCVFASYKLVILNQLHAACFAYGTAVLNALVLSKVILIGEYFGVARKHENRSVLVPAMDKALVFAVLVAIVHILEEGIREALRGHNLAAHPRGHDGRGLAGPSGAQSWCFAYLFPSSVSWRYAEGWGRRNTWI